MLENTGTGDVVRAQTALGVLHAELYSSHRTGEPILVGCTCTIGRTHTYEEWIMYFQVPDSWVVAADSATPGLDELALAPEEQSSVGTAERQRSATR